MKRWLLVLTAAFACVLLPASAPAAAVPPHVIIFALPGITWEDVLHADTPELDRLIEKSAVAAAVVRGAARGSTPVRGYLTLGAGQRAFALPQDMRGNVALPADAPFENTTAAEAVARRFASWRRGAIVHPHLAWIEGTREGPDYGTELGALGEALAGAGIPRGVVSAADLAPDARGPATMRRSAVLGLVDRAGTVDHGRVTGLVQSAPGPFGVWTDPHAFATAVKDALTQARVVLVDPGETQRADEWALSLPRLRVDFVRRAALARASTFLGIVERMLEPRDLLLVVAPSSPVGLPIEHLTPVIASGAGFGRGWLTSPRTRREGMVLLTDIAPTVLDSLSVPVPESMGGAPIRFVAAPAGGRARSLAALDEQSVFRERFVVVVTALFIGLLVLLALLAFVTFLVPGKTRARVLLVCAYAVLTVPPAALMVRAADLRSLPAASALLVGLVLVLLGAALVVPGPRWAAGVALLLLSLGLMGGDLLSGARLQLNSAFGYSPLLAGRFYGIGNLGYAVLFSAGILGLLGLADLLGHQRAPAWVGAGLTGLVLLEGLPALGADFGGILAGVPAVLVAYSIGRGRRIRWRSIAAWAVAAGLIGVAMMLLDVLRPPESRTHLGDFAVRVWTSGGAALWTFVKRKLQANIGLFGWSYWTFTIPVTLAVMILLLWRPRGVLRAVVPKHPLLSAGLTGALVAGVVGYAVNDSGIAVPAMVLAHVVPLVVLMGLQTILPPSDRGVRSLPPRVPRRA